MRNFVKIVTLNVIKMKKLFTLVFVLFLINIAHSQSGRDLLNNFRKSESNIVYWQNYVETNLSLEQLVDRIIESCYFKDIDVSGFKVVCELKPYKLNYMQYSSSVLDNTPVYLTQNLITASVIFELSDNRYSVVIKNINLIDNTPDKLGVVTTLEEYVLNRQQDLKIQPFRVGSDILNKDFINKTTFSQLISGF